MEPIRKIQHRYTSSPYDSVHPVKPAQPTYMTPQYARVPDPHRRVHTHTHALIRAYMGISEQYLAAYAISPFPHNSSQGLPLLYGRGRLGYYSLEGAAGHPVEWWGGGTRKDPGRGGYLSRRTTDRYVSLSRTEPSRAKGCRYESVKLYSDN